MGGMLVGNETRSGDDNGGLQWDLSTAGQHLPGTGRYGGCLLKHVHIIKAIIVGQRQRVFVWYTCCLIIIWNFAVDECLAKQLTLHLFEQHFCANCDLNACCLHFSESKAVVFWGTVWRESPASGFQISAEN